ncbi:MAG: hypothetical protein EOP84_33120, partial [Verrucomicrobiaceae bacterium]
MQAQKTLALSCAGHTETIFACKFSPACEDTFATASYDQTVKIWHLSGPRLKQTLLGAGDIVYTLDWAAGGRQLVGGMASGLIVVWDLDTGRQIARYLQHTKPVYCVSFSILQSQLLVSAGGDGILHVFQVDLQDLVEAMKTNVSYGISKRGGVKDTHKQDISAPNVKFRLVHSAPLFGAAFHPAVKDTVVSACQDGQIRIFSLSRPSAPLVSICVGHSARAFGVSFSPLSPHLLASSSDDLSVRRVDHDV